MKKEEIKYFCDICGENTKEKDIFQVNYPVIFTTNQTDGASSKPYIEQKQLDVCRHCADKVLKLQKQLDEEYESGFIWEGKAREEVNKLKQQLADAEEHIDALELQLREQYQLVDEKDKEIEKYKERVYEHTPPFAGEDDYDDLFNDVLTHGGICVGNWLFYGKYTLSHETWDNGFCHNVFVMNIINDLKTMIKKKDKELLEFKRDRLYFELLLTRLQWLHEKAGDCIQEKERFGVAHMSLYSVWDVLELQKNDLCEYEEMWALQEGIECVAKSELLGDIEHDLQVKATRSENEIFKDIEQINQQIKELKGE